jgi:hypothetical protein
MLVQYPLDGRAWARGREYSRRCIGRIYAVVNRSLVQEPVELQFEGLVQRAWRGPVEVLFLQKPSTASSGRRGTFVTCGVT